MEVMLACENEIEDNSELIDSLSSDGFDHSSSDYGLSATVGRPLKQLLRWDLCCQCQ